jgi:hypothetical protein
MEQGHYRRDLYYRVAGYALRVPALRDRREDIPALVEGFMRAFAREADKSVRGITVKALHTLVEYGWPGNISELEHEVRRLVYLCPEGQAIDSGMLSRHLLVPSLREEPPHLVGVDGSLDLNAHVQKIEESLIRHALARASGNRTQAAKLLGVSDAKRITLWLGLLVVVFLAWHFAQIQKKEQAVKFSEFMSWMESGQVSDVTIAGNEIKGHTTNREPFKTFAPVGYDKLLDALLAKKVTINYQPDQTPTRANMLISWAPFILLIGLWILFMRQMQKGRTIRTAEAFAGLSAQQAELEQLLAEARRLGTRTIVSLILTRGVPSGEGKSARLIVPAAADVIRLELDVGKGSAHRSYRAVIRTPEGDQAWGRGGLCAGAAGSVSALIVEIPAKVLPTGEYTLILSGSTGAGDTEDVADYSFSIVGR